MDNIKILVNYNKKKENKKPLEKLLEFTAMIMEFGIGKCAALIRRKGNEKQWKIQNYSIRNWVYSIFALT